MNIPAFFVSALIPLVVGFVYYHKKVVGSAWMNVTGMTDEKAKEGNMAVIFGFTYIFSVFIAMTLSMLVIHQSGVLSLFGGDATDPMYQDIMATKGEAFRTFGHGALHGFISSIMFALPIIAINGLFEQRGWKYIWINVGYWAITLTLMGGLLCAWK